MELYRGDTFSQDIVFENYTLSEGDIVKVGVKKSIKEKNYILFQEISIERASTETTFYFSAEQTSAFELDTYLFEIELTYNINKVETVYQEPLSIIGDVIYDNSST